VSKLKKAMIGLKIGEPVKRAVTPKLQSKPGPSQVASKFTNRSAASGMPEMLSVSKSKKSGGLGEGVCCPAAQSGLTM